jgi:cytoskeletal protein CcmA (bactofilin family)
MLQSSVSRKVLSILGISAILVTVLALAVASPARAAEVITGEPDAILPAGQVVDDDLFIAGQNVRVEGTVNGDVFAAGNTVEVTGTIEGNLFVGAQLFVNNGTVNGSVYSGSYVATIGPAAVVADNVYGFAFSVSSEAGSSIGRSMYAFAYQSIVSGEIGRDLNFFGSALRVDGNIARNLKAEIGEPDPQTTDYNGPWMMWMPGNVETLQPGYDVSSGTVGGETDIRVVEYTAPDAPSVRVEPRTIWGVTAASWVVMRVSEFMTLFLVGVLLFLVWPTQMKRVEDQIVARPWRSLGVGFLAAILFPFAFLLALLVVILLAVFFGIVSLGGLVGPILTVGFLLIGLAAVAFCVAGLLAAKSIVGHMIGERLLQSTTEDKGWGLVLILLVGVLIYEVVALVPVLGWLVGITIVLLGWGAIAGVLWMKEAKPATRKARK